MDGECSPVRNTDPEAEAPFFYLPVGSACNNYTGYCDVNGHCITIDADSALDRLKELFTKKGVEDMKEWMAINWLVIRGGGYSSI